MSELIEINGLFYKEIEKPSKVDKFSKAGHTVNKDDSVDPFDTILTYAFTGHGMYDVIDNLHKKFDTKKFDNYTLSEVELILQKKSNLSSAERKQIMIWFNQDYEEVR
jgi:hypothetical protein